MAGVGETIRTTLAAFGIYSLEGCYCTTLAKKMDEDGPEEVEKKLEYYVKEMKESIKQWRRQHTTILPSPPELVIRQLIIYGIQKSKESLQNSTP